MLAINRIVSNTLEKYHKERLSFAQTIAELAQRETYVSTLQSHNVLPLLRPLLLDNIPAIQQAAALAIGRLANHSEELAEAVVDSDILPHLIFSLKNQNRFYKTAAAFVLRTVAKHSAKLANSVVESGALTSLVQCLEEFDPGVKESAAWALGYIAKHNEELAKAVVDAGALPLLILCIQEPELSLRKISISALSDIAKHSSELAHNIVDTNALFFLTQLIHNSDPKLLRQVCSCLCQIAKHNIALAEEVVDREIFPRVLYCLKNNDIYVRKNAASLICEISKHSADLAQIIVNAGGIASILDYIDNSTGNAKLPGIMTIGYISVFSDTLAFSVLLAKPIPILLKILNEKNISDESVLSASVWALGQMGRHSPEHAKILTDHGVLHILLKLYQNYSNDKDEILDLKAKIKKTLKWIIENTLNVESLEPLLSLETPLSILKPTIEQLSKIIPNDITVRRDFVTSGSLKTLQEVAQKFISKDSNNPSYHSKLAENILIINNCYPEEIVKYYSPGYSEILLSRIDEYMQQTNAINA
ncbi:ARM repeat-containing protein [Anaeromyces robustus]|uniref:ARM repeat-containing protein n=1 Tax=Anaeromyces robustus TaxID=1754192 RepID=A0A1Y1WWG7_9FUNG|nr:ARM repeat-containing protein [Anaeromyces robustus]|eukprot:ORX77474.1 ARM repeat-containing protein [Anaeromyces robustus]